MESKIGIAKALFFYVGPPGWLGLAGVKLDGLT